jgi:predicted CXXCH cytochrome family protein
MRGPLAIAGLLAFMLLPRDVHAQTSMGDATAAFQDDVHAGAGLTCVACHTTRPGGGAYQAPLRTAIAPLCATCHSDAAYMPVRSQVNGQFLRYRAAPWQANSGWRTTWPRAAVSRRARRRVSDARSSWHR